MSEIVHYTGKIQYVEKLQNETLEEQCKRILSEHNHNDLYNYYDSWVEMLCDELYGEYIVAYGKIYKILDKNPKDTDGDIFNAHYNRDGTIDYDVMYYNCGCSLNEAIERALDSLKKEVRKRD